MQEETYVSVPHVGTLDGTTLSTFGHANTVTSMHSAAYNPLSVLLQPMTIVASISDADVERIADAVLRKIAQRKKEAAHE